VSVTILGVVVNAVIHAAAVMSLVAAAVAVVVGGKVVALLCIRVVGLILVAHAKRHLW
jgi:hypothetical protein